MRRQLDSDGRTKLGYVGMLDANWESDSFDGQLVCNNGSVLNVNVATSAEYKDDLTGQALCPKLVREARRK